MQQTDSDGLLYIEHENYDKVFIDETERDHKSVKILDYTNHKCVLEKDRLLHFGEISNFERGLSPYGATSNHNRCVMCGITDVAIPTQNKNVCKSCDSVPWYVKSCAVVVKFCKGETTTSTASSINASSYPTECGGILHLQAPSKIRTTSSISIIQPPPPLCATITIIITHSKKINTALYRM